MANAIKKQTPKKKTASKKKVTTKKTNTAKKDSSMGIMLLVAAGLILQIYFGSSVSVDVEMSVNETKQASENNETSIIISGKRYPSLEAARESLKFMPQSQLTDEEINFVESYKE